MPPRWPLDHHQAKTHLPFPVYLGGKTDQMFPQDSGFLLRGVIFSFFGHDPFLCLMAIVCDLSKRGNSNIPSEAKHYFVRSVGQIVALLGFGAAAWQTAPRDRFIGWTHEQRKANLHLVVNNARFLILPWVRSHNLASMILAKAAKTLPDHWQSAYNVRPVLLETFVEKPRFQGTCYRAANWIYLGQTKGRGKLGPRGKQSVPIKDILVYPLDRGFKTQLKK